MSSATGWRIVVRAKRASTADRKAWLPRQTSRVQTLQTKMALEAAGGGDRAKGDKQKHI